jgi:hypothetical protein
MEVLYSCTIIIYLIKFLCGESDGGIKIKNKWNELPDVCKNH